MYSLITKEIHMGTICILIGLIILIAFTGIGFFTSTMIAGNQLYMSLLKVSDPAMVYVFIVGAFALIGLLICLSLVMNGLIYNRVCKNGAELKRIKRG